MLPPFLFDHQRELRSRQNPASFCNRTPEMLGPNFQACFRKKVGIRTGLANQRGRAGPARSVSRARIHVTSRDRAGYAAENPATLRHLTLNLLRRDETKKRGIRDKQLKSGWDHAYLLCLLGV
jgi:hypothetical protein